MALIIVLSVMNGFQDELKSRILSVTSHIEITKPGKDLNNWQQTKETIVNNMDIKGVSPYVTDQAMISVGKRNRGVMVRGIFPEIEKDVNDINTKISSGAYRLNAEQYNILIGTDLARYLGVSVGDKIAMISSKSNFSAAGIMPRLKRFNISGIFDSGMYEYDAGLVLINLKDAQTFFKTNNNVSGLRLELNEIDDTEKISSNLKNIFSYDPFIYVSDWRAQHANLFAAIKLEKKVMEELYDRESRATHKEAPSTFEINGQKLPDPKLHQTISFIKSGIRIIACIAGFSGFYGIGFFGLLIAELVGIYEELV